MRVLKRTDGLSHVETKRHCTSSYCDEFLHRLKQELDIKAFDWGVGERPRLVT